MSRQLPPVPPVPNLPGAAVPPAPPAAKPTPQPPGTVPPPPAAPIDQLPTVSFWQQPFVQNVLPFITSLVLHLSLILLVLATYKVAQRMVEVVQQQIIIPESGMEEAVEGGIPHPGLGGDPTRDAAQDKYPDVSPDSTGWAEKPGKNLTQALMGGGAGEAEGASVIGVGGAMGGKGKGLGTGSGDNIGSGQGDGRGPLAPFGIPGGGGGLGKRGKFFKTDIIGRKVCYVCDASGSMMSKFDDLRAEIRRSIEGLRPNMAFNVVFFQEDSATAIDANGLLVANPQNKQRTNDFLDRVVAAKQTNPIPALDIAFRQKPDLIYLLTDGEFPDNDKVISFIAEHNADKKIKINTIAFVGRGETYEKVLKQIAADNGGIFKYVAEEELGGN